MRTLLPIFVLALCASVPASGQAIRFDSTATTTSAQCVSGKQCPLLVLPGTQINFCQGTPSTVGGCLSSPATTYTSQAASVPCSTTAQLTPGVGGACLATADAQGGYGAWLLPGSYSYYLRVPVTAGGGTYGPYVLSIHGDSGGYTFDSLYSTLAQACTAAGSGTLAITRAWNATPSQTLACSVWFLGDGKIQTATSASIVFGSGFTCPASQQCLDSSTNSGGSFTWAKIPPSYYPQWWGAKGDGATNDTVAIQAALNVVASTGGVVQISPGRYSVCALTLRTSNPVTVSGYGARIFPSCADQYVLTVYGESNKVLGLSFSGTGGVHYQGIRLLSDSTSISTQYNVVRDVYMFNMYRGILEYMDAVGTPSAVTYRNDVESSTIQNFYNQKTWSGSFGISFDGTVNGNSGGNDASVHMTGVKGYESNVIVRNSTGTKISESWIDGGLNGILYDGGSNLDLAQVYMEYNTNVVTTASTLLLPYQMVVSGGTQANYSTCLNGALYQSGVPVHIGNPGASCFPTEIGIIGAEAGGVVAIRATNEIDLGPIDSGAGETDKVKLKRNGSGDWIMDFSSLTNARSFTFYRPSFAIYMTSGNMSWDATNLTFGNASSTHLQFPQAAGLGSALHSDGGFSANFNGLWMASNETKTGTQANAAYPSWAIDLGGYDNLSYPLSSDTFGLFHRTAGGSFTRFLKVSNAGAWVFANGFGINILGAPTIGSEAFASLGGDVNGTMYYCTDCKNVQNDAATAGATCVGGGSGSIARRENTQWHCN